MNALQRFLEPRKQRFIGYYAELRIIIFLILIGLFTLSLPYLNRNVDSLIGEDSYYNYRIANDIVNKHTLPSYDYLSFSGRTYVFSLTPLILLIFSKALGSLILTARLLPILLGLLVIALFYLILKKSEINNTIKILSCIILILSPGFTYLFTTLNDYSLPIVILLGILLLILYERYRVAIVLSLFIPLFGSIHAFIAAILFIFYSSKKGELKEFKWFFVIVLLILSTLVPLFLYGFSYNFFFRPLDYSYLKKFLSDLGGNFGFNIFVIFLAVIGLTKLWEEKYKHITIYLSITFLILISLFEIKSLFYLNFFAVFLASIGLIKLVEIEWESKLIQYITIIIIIAGLIISFLSHSYLLSISPPNKEMIDALEFLKSKDNEGVVFSYYSNGILINSLANKKNIMDSNFLYAPDLKGRYENSNEMLFTRDIENATRIINKYDIRYILIDKDMEEKLWGGEEEGLLFLTRYSKRFNLTYYNDFTTILEVNKE